jgi:hypothetical protein
VVTVACGPNPSIELELPGPHEFLRPRLLAHVEERTPRFFKDGDGRFMVRGEAGSDGRWSGHIDWIEAQRHKIAEVGYQQYLAQQIYS